MFLQAVGKALRECNSFALNKDFYQNWYGERLKRVAIFSAITISKITFNLNKSCSNMFLEDTNLASDYNFVIII